MDCTETEAGPSRDRIPGRSCRRTQPRVTLRCRPTHLEPTVDNEARIPAAREPA
ncbi:hypothetical protein [Streptomyces montanus]|uniref:hypothetical protein n=1 Tax=Streptomyces montanus TaxID=2580423 RepID=UPI0014871A95|nr:hypothetical protein [Streptomyces montanus]